MNFTGHCIEDLQRALFSHDQQPTSYFDATGKVGSGIAIGNTVWLGQFKYCRTLPQSLYCLADIEAKVQLPDQSNETNIALRWGICGVDSCNGSVIRENIESIWNGTLGFPVSNFASVDVNCEEAIEYSTHFYGTIGLCVVLLVLCCLGTLSDIWIQHKDSLRWKLVYNLSEEGPHLVDTDFDSQINSDSTTDSSVPTWQRPPDPQLVNSAFKPKLGMVLSALCCFSVYNTLRRLTVVPPSSPGSIPCLHGLRVLSITWIVLGHTFLSMFVTRMLVNPGDMLEMSRTIAWQPVGNAYFAVDTFFLLGGILVSYLGLQELDKRNGSFPLAKFYLHRYLRLTPLMGFIMLIWMYIKPYMGDGPQWFTMQTDPLCQNYWWTNLLYIQNFYPTNATHMCIGWVWYLALDMQFYLISPIIIYLLYRNHKAGMVVISLLILVSFIVTAFLIVYYKIEVNLTGSVINMDIQAMEAFETVINDKPYCRISPYLVGMVLGDMLYQEIDTPRRKMAMGRVLVGWILAIGTMAALIYGLYPTFHDEPLDLAGNVCYGTFSRFAWAVALSWVIYVCHHGYGGPVGHLLSWPGWAPFSRLTYPVYLFHPVLMYIIYHSQYWPIFVSNFTIAAYYVSVLAMAFVSSIILSVLIEIPLLNVERLIVSRP